MRKILYSMFAGVFLASFSVLPVAAYGNSQNNKHNNKNYIVVNPANEQGWNRDSTRHGGVVNFVNDPTAPRGKGALELTTPLLPTTAIAQYMHPASTNLSAITELSYYTKQISPPGTIADPAYQLVVCLTGATATGCNPQANPPVGTGSSFTTLVFEPYQNPAQGPIVNNVWQKWDVGAGLFWSTRTVRCSNGVINGTPGGPATYTLSQIKTMCPEAFVFKFGVNVGSNNPGYVVRTDLFNFNGTIYDFEPGPSSKKDCKNDGYKKFTNPAFKNQGQCIKYVENQNDHDDDDRDHDHDHGNDDDDRRGRDD